MRRDVDDLDFADLKPWIAPPAPPATEPAFWENVERWEARVCNRPGTEKAWVQWVHEDWAIMVGSVVCERPGLTGRARLFQELNRANVRYLVIGVGGADLHAQKYKKQFNTKDLDIFLPRDPENLVACWAACESAGLSLWCNKEPLDFPRDVWLARKVVGTRSLTTAQGYDIVPTDLTLVMGSLDFEDVWFQRTLGHPDGVPADLARMADIVESKRQADRPKDHSFLGQNRELIDLILEGEGPPKIWP